MKKIIFCLFGFVTFSSVQASVSELKTEVNNNSNSANETISKNNWDDAVVTDAMSNFKSLSRVERKARVKEVKKYLKEYKANTANATASNDKVLLAILSILLPPLAVYLHQGSTNDTFWISVLLTLLFWLPGVIFALITVL